MALISKKRRVLYLLFVFLFILIGFHRMILPKWPVIMGEFPKLQPAVALSVSQSAPVTLSGAGQSNEQKLSKPADSVVFNDELQGFALDSSGEALSLMATVNGGLSWQYVHRFPHTTGEEQLAFLDSQTGWLLSGLSSDRKPELQLTSDGGKTWEVIARDLPGFDTLIARISFFRFFDRQNGLIAVQSDQDMVLLRTQDGGLTWSASSRITLPRQLPGLLAFTTPNEGWLVNGGHGDQAAILYRMTNGDSWQSAGKLPERTTVQAISFADRQDGGILLHAPGAEASSWQLLRTQDGGASWSRHEFPAGTTLTTDAQMSFTSSSDGWLLSKFALWRTADGGLSWTRQ